MIQIDSDIVCRVNAIHGPFENYREAIDKFVPIPDSNLCNFDMLVAKFKSFEDTDMQWSRFSHDPCASGPGQRRLWPPSLPPVSFFHPRPPHSRASY